LISKTQGQGMTTAKKRIWGWYFFDFASQPYNTLLLTFIFAPYMASIMGDGSAAQSVWGYGIGFAGLVIAIASPLLGAVADRTGGRMQFIWLFSIMYVVGAAALWYAAPGNLNVWFIMVMFGIGLIGMEFATSFTNAMMPDLVDEKDLGSVSGSGFSFGYIGGFITLLIMLLLLDDGSNGKTLLGNAPLFGLDPEQREGTRSVGPLSAIWYIVFMIPFFLWVRETPQPGAVPIGVALREAIPDLMRTLRTLPARPSFSAYLASSMFYRDALNGMYTFGGIYAAGVLNWETMNIGIFGILAIISGIIFAWLGGKADRRFGPKPVITATVIVLTLTALAVVGISRESVLGMPVAPDSPLPDYAFYLIGMLIGAAGGILQAASRTMMVHQADPARMTEAFGLFALTGKATSFLAPLLIAVTTQISGSQSIGVAPLVGLFLIGLILLIWVKPYGDDSRSPQR
jgi:MFS transporter, UMF1 family